MPKFKLTFLRSKPLVSALLIVVALTFGIIGGTGLVIQRFVYINASLQQAYIYNATLDETLSLLTDAETATRGFILTRDASYLEPYHHAKQQLPQVLQETRREIGPEQYRRLSDLVDQRITVLTTAVNKYQGDPGAAVTVTGSGRGKALMDQIRTMVSGLQQEKTAQIKRQSLAANHLSNWVLLALVGCALLDAVLIGFVLRLARNLERKEQALEKSQAELQSIVDYAPNYIQILDLNLTRVFINKAATNETAEPLLERTFGEFMKPKERRRVHALLKKVVQTGKPTEFEFSTYLNNSQQWFKNSVGPIYTEHQITGLIIITFDVTGEKQATQILEERKRQAEAAQVRDKALLDSIGDGLLVIDENGTITNANPEAAQALGYSTTTLIGAWFPGVVLALDELGNPVDPIDRPATQALMTGRTISTRMHYQRQDGSVFPVLITVSPVVINGKPVGAIEVFRDLTVEHELEQAKEDFVSLASHQLRTPATGAKAFISMLIDGYGGTLNNRQREFLQKILRANERQLEIVNDMLNVARIDSGRIIPEFAETDLISLLRNVVEEQQPILDERNQHVRMIVPAKAPPAVCDPNLIHMAIENMISNASKYSHEGGMVTITLRFTKKQAHITIKDTGVGIAKADLPKLFQRFTRIHNSLSISRGGTGLGLYLAQKIISKHDGQIVVDSTPGVGTTFGIELPLNPISATMQDNLQPLKVGEQT